MMMMMSKISASKYTPPVKIAAAPTPVESEGEEEDSPKPLTTIGGKKQIEPPPATPANGQSVFKEPETETTKKAKKKYANEELEEGVEPSGNSSAPKSQPKYLAQSSPMSASGDVTVVIEPSTCTTDHTKNTRTCTEGNSSVKVRGRQLNNNTGLTDTADVTIKLNGQNVNISKINPEQGIGVVSKDPNQPSTITFKTKDGKVKEGKLIAGEALSGTFDVNEHNSFIKKNKKGEEILTVSHNGKAAKYLIIED